MRLFSSARAQPRAEVIRSSFPRRRTHMPGLGRIGLIVSAFVLAAGSAATLHTAASPLRPGPSRSTSHQADQEAARRDKPSSGQNIFRFDTFNDEQLWTSVLRM